LLVTFPLNADVPGRGGGRFFSMRTIARSSNDA
jgi:hypothetical protein